MSSPTDTDPAPKARYSQNDEDETIKRWFAENPPKFGKRLADIGAWDGVHMSNSRALVLDGWNAVLVEAAAAPLVSLMEACRGRKGVRIVNAFVVGATTTVHETGLTVLQHTADAVSTADPEVFAAWRPIVKDYFPIMVPVLRVEQLLRAFPGPYDLVSIDTEGETLSIFADVLERADVSCFVVEHSVAGRSTLEEMRALAVPRGYTEVALNGENVVFGKP